MDINPAEYKLLVVDDVMENVILLKALLKREQYQIVTAMNGQEALDKVAQESPDLILLDIMMPGMDGYEVARRLKSNPQTHEIPIVFLTALNATKDIVNGFTVGGNDFISKPFNKEELIIRIRHQLSLIAAKRIIDHQNQVLKSTIEGRDRMCSVIAHDLRSPMGSIKMVLNALLISVPEEKIGKEAYEMIMMANETTEETFSLLDNLLKWAKSQLGRLNVVYQDIDLVEVADAVLEVFSMVARIKKINIRTEMPEKAPVNADSNMLNTVIRNLLSNAIKYSEEGSEIIISIQQDEENATLHVKDSGKGIREEDQPKLFRSDSNYTTYGTKNEEGSGLGLLLCQDFVTKNGGKIWFVSHEGEGSTFSFSIPKKREAEA